MADKLTQEQLEQLAEYIQPIIVKIVAKVEEQIIQQVAIKIRQNNCQNELSKRIY